MTMLDGYTDMCMGPGEPSYLTNYSKDDVMLSQAQHCCWLQLYHSKCNNHVKFCGC